MIAKNSSAAVGAKFSIASMIASDTLPGSSGMIAAPIATARIPKATGTRINANTGVNRLLKIKYMKTAIMVNPRPTSIIAPLGFSC